MSYNAEFGPSTRREGNKLKYKEIERKLYKKEKSQRKEQERRERPSSCRLGKTKKKALHRLEKVLEYDNISVSLEPEPEPEPVLAIDEIESSRVIRRQFNRPRRKVSLYVLKNNISETSNLGEEEDQKEEEEEDYWANYKYYQELYDRKVRNDEKKMAKLEHDILMHDLQQARLYRLVFMNRY